MALELVQARRVNRVEVERLQSAGLPQIDGRVARSSGVAAHAATVDRRHRRFAVSYASERWLVASSLGHAATRGRFT